LNGAVDRVAMHGVRRDLLEAQAVAAGLPLWSVPLPDPCSNAEYEGVMTAVVQRAVAEGFTHVAFGDLFLQDVRRYREERLAGSGLDPLFPLWGLPTRELAGTMIDGGLRARVVCVDTRILPAGFAGREFDGSLLAGLPPGVDPCGENGEFHTCVYGGPMFASRLAIESGRTVHRDPFTWIELLPQFLKNRDLTPGGESRSDPE
jgi:diphthamide synthase (EF-2-diphthine--ammonia ligase)